MQDMSPKDMKQLHLKLNVTQRWMFSYCLHTGNRRGETDGSGCWSLRLFESKIIESTLLLIPGAVFFFKDDSWF